MSLQNVVLNSLGASKLTSCTALGVNVGVLEAFGPPTWGSGSPLDVQVGVLGRLWASKWNSMRGFGGSQVRLQNRVLGLLSQLENVFGCTFAMLRKTQKNQRKT